VKASNENTHFFRQLITEYERTNKEKTEFLKIKNVIAINYNQGGQTPKKLKKEVLSGFLFFRKRLFAKNK
jgi:hypothetical protein